MAPQRAIAPIVVACLAVTLALVLAVLWGLDARGLQQSRAEVVDLTGQVDGLAGQVAAAEKEQSSLRRELTAAQEYGESGRADLDAEKTDLQDLSQALNERERTLDARERKLDGLAADLAEREQALEDRDKGSTRPGDTAESLPDADQLDRALLRSLSQDVVAEIRAVDRRLRRGSGVPTALTSLSDSLARLGDAGVPPGLEVSTYRAQLASLQQLAADAAELYDRNPTAGAAKYAALRERTRALLAQVDKAPTADLRP